MRPGPAAYLVLTGGAGRRLGGVDKASIDIGGRAPLQYMIELAAPLPTVVVGPIAMTPMTGPHVTVTSEDPPSGGPAAGLVAGLAALVEHHGADLADDDLIAVIAVDQVGVTSTTVGRLAAAARRDPRGGAILVADGRRHYGVGVFTVAALRSAAAANERWHGRSLRSLVDPVVGAEVPAVGAEARDIDTPDDLAWWRAHGLPTGQP